MVHPSDDTAGENIVDGDHWWINVMTISNEEVGSICNEVSQEENYGRQSAATIDSLGWVSTSHFAVVPTTTTKQGWHWS